MGRDVCAHDVDRWADPVSAEMMLGKPDRVVTRLVHHLHAVERLRVDRLQRHPPPRPAGKLITPNFIRSLPPDPSHPRAGRTFRRPMNIRPIFPISRQTH